MSDPQEYLVKYCTVESAKTTLAQQQLRWRSPDLFLDPFEINSRVTLNFDKSALLPAAIKVATSMIFSRDMPKGDTPLINAIIRWRNDQRFHSPEEAQGVLQELLGKMIDARFLHLEKLLTHWQDYNKKLRICCFGTNETNPVSWQRFGENHKGVAIRFRRDEQNCFSQAQAVSYGINQVELTNVKEQILAIINQKNDDAIERFPKLFLQKPLFYKSENEWRCLRRSNKTDIGDDQNTWVDEIPFNPQSVASICFGLKTSEDDKKLLLELAKKHYSGAKIYQVVLEQGKYALTLQKL